MILAKTFRNRKVLIFSKRSTVMILMSSTTNKPICARVAAMTTVAHNKDKLG